MEFETQIRSFFDERGLKIKPTSIQFIVSSLQYLSNPDENLQSVLNRIESLIAIKKNKIGLESDCVWLTTEHDEVRPHLIERSLQEKLETVAVIRFSLNNQGFSALFIDDSVQTGLSVIASFTHLEELLESLKHRSITHILDYNNNVRPIQEFLDLLSL